MSKQYNIMTSCDDKIVRYVPVELMAMAHNLKDAHVDFYLFHSRVSPANIEMLDNFCKNLDEGRHITFHEIKVPNPEIYDELATYGGGWCGEAYYHLSAHLLLPESVERVLYLDAADTLIIGDISPYYNYGFNGKSLIVTGSTYRGQGDGNLTPFSESDLSDHENALPVILRGLFNSGSVVFNLAKMRQDERTIADYQYLAQALHGIVGGDKNKVYYGDQGLLAATFVGDIQYYYFTEIQNVFYMPYNFCMWYHSNFIAPPPFETPILHYTGAAFKPWLGKYPIYLKRLQEEEAKLHSLGELKDNQSGYFYLWHEYAIMTDRLLEKIGY
jgi:lipopolysaccharide biosynthesis glycosyltransferase